MLNTKKVSQAVTKCHFTKMMKKTYFTSGLCTSNISRNNSVGFHNLFSDSNKEIVMSRMKKAKPLVRPVEKEEQRREAAVLVPMCHIDGEPALIFMMRSRYLKNHRGEISFPGGIKDPGDRDLIHTALRETFEEIGLPESQVDVWGTVPPSPSRVQVRRNNSGWVTPVLGYCRNVNIDQLNINESEVEEVFVRTISSLCDPANQRQTQWRYPGTKGYTLPVFLGEEHRIWGLTAIIIHQVLGLIAPELYKFKLKHLN